MKTETLIGKKFYGKIEGLIGTMDTCMVKIDFMIPEMEYYELVVTRKVKTSPVTLLEVKS